MHIRNATPNDIPVMSELLHELFAIEADFSPHSPTQILGLKLLLERDSAEIFVAVIDNKVVGMCTVQILVSTAKGREVGTVEDVVVDIEHRGQGVGSALLRNLEEWAFIRGLARLQLQSDRDKPLPRFLPKARLAPHQSRRLDETPLARGAAAQINRSNNGH
jgi:ribosomal protein S18 acetylase RimI-like enzyme